MSSEFYNPCPIPPPPPQLGCEVTDQAIAAAEAEAVHASEVTQVIQSGVVQRAAFDLNQVAPMVAPEFGEPPESIIESVEPKHSIVSQSATASKTGTMTHFWVVVIGLGMLLLLAMSDLHAKNGPRIPQPNTSRIPQMR